MAAWSALALLPDADLIGFALGVNYTDPWGHRGATHSLIFAIAIGLIVGLAAWWFKRPIARTALLVSAAIGSHGLLDSLTDAGLGCALLWPFDLTRYFAPWRPLPAAPIGLGMLSPYAAIVVAAELALFSPLLYFAMRPAASRTRPIVNGAVAGIWLVSAWLIVSTDPVRETLVGFILRDRTEYTAGYSERTFRAIGQGTPEEEVRRLLGPPRGESWFYPPRLGPTQSASETSVASLRDCRAIRSEHRAVVMADEPEACRALGIQPGTSLDEVHRLLGAPREWCWQYSWSPGFAFRLRLICFYQGRVDDVVRGWAISE